MVYNVVQVLYLILDIRIQRIFRRCRKRAFDAILAFPALVLLKNQANATLFQRRNSRNSNVRCTDEAM